MASDAGSLAFGDIVLVPFPFTNQAASKQRPGGRLAQAFGDQACHRHARKGADHPQTLGTLEPTDRDALKAALDNLLA